MLELLSKWILSNCFFSRIQKQGTKHRSIISMLCEIFCKDFTVFNVSPDTAANFFKLFSLAWIRAIHIQALLLYSLFLLFSCFIIFVFYLLVCLCGYHVIVTSMSSIFVSMYLHFALLGSFMLTYTIYVSMGCQFLLSLLL